VRQDARAAFDRALVAARVAAYPPGQFVGQESFMTADEILDLAVRAGVGSGATVLDLCCGVAGPGRLVTRRLGCRYTGVDVSAETVALATERAGDLDCRFLVGEVPPVPPGPFDVVLLLETMLAFADKQPLVAGVAEALVDGGRFAFTLEEGVPLTGAERAAMPDDDTVWPERLDVLTAMLAGAGLAVLWTADVTSSHLVVAEALTAAYAMHRRPLAEQIGMQAVDDLVAAHRLWVEWLRSGRIRKVAVVAGCGSAVSST
jgi:sarcosine/dimethylglycine N-methyltransferase